MPQTQEQNINLTIEQKEKYVDELLIYMKNELEKNGESIKIGMFDFHFAYIQKYAGAPDKLFEEGDALTEFKKIVNIDDDIFQTVMNYCFTNQYVKRLYFEQRQFDNVQLTADGFARAKSVEMAQYKKPITDNTQNIHIGSITSDNVQIGNNNVQNISTSFQYLIDEINKSDATDEDKKNALTKLQDFIYNPVVSGILSTGVVETIKGLIGA